MLRKKRHPMLFMANVFIFSFIILFDTSELADISIKTATPMLVLPLLSRQTVNGICGLMEDMVTNIQILSFLHRGMQK